MYHAWHNGLCKITTRKIEAIKEIGRQHKTICYKKTLQYDLQGNLLKEWESVSEAAKQLKMNQGNISACCRGERKTAGKYKWKYKDTQ